MSALRERAREKRTVPVKVRPEKPRGSDCRFSARWLASAQRVNATECDPELHLVGLPACRSIRERDTHTQSEVRMLGSETRGGGWHATGAASRLSRWVRLKDQTLSTAGRAVAFRSCDDPSKNHWRRERERERERESVLIRRQCL